MSNFLFDAIRNRYSNRSTPSGWTSFNAPCCTHTGNHRQDRGKRSGVKLDQDAVIFNCFNCGYRTIYREGGFITRKMHDLLGWMGFSQQDVGRFDHKALALRMQAQGRVRITLPDGLRSLADWADADCLDDRFLAIADFLTTFDKPHDLRLYYWTPDPNGMALDGYIISINGDESYPTGWSGFPFIDPSQPHRTHEGIEPEPDDTIPPHILAEMDRLWSEMADGEDVETEEKP